MFRSLVDLQQTINTFISIHNDEPKPFGWKADPKVIIAAAKREHQVDASGNLAALAVIG